MLISHSEKLLFIHIQRTGGTSISEVFNDAVPDVQSINLMHDNANTVVQDFFPPYKDYLKFAFVRNPWARVFSWYALSRKYNVIRRNPFFTLDEFIEHYEEVRAILGIDKYFLFNQLDYISNGKDELVTDIVGRYENLEDDLRRIFLKRNICIKDIPKINSASNGDYAAHYSARSRILIEQRCQKDIETFAYLF